MNLKKKPSRHALTAANPSAEDRDNESVHNKIPIAKTIITPEIRCNIEAFAEGCILSTLVEFKRLENRKKLTKYRNVDNKFTIYSLQETNVAKSVFCLPSNLRKCKFWHMISAVIVGILLSTIGDW